MDQTCDRWNPFNSTFQICHLYISEELRNGAIWYLVLANVLTFWQTLPKLRTRWMKNTTKENTRGVLSSFYIRILIIKYNSFNQYFFTKVGLLLGPTLAKKKRFYYYKILWLYNKMGGICEKIHILEPIRWQNYPLSPSPTLLFMNLQYVRFIKSPC